jgi:hypothetical protein
MESKEKLAKQYAEELNSAYTNDYYGFLAGYNKCEELLKKYIEFIEEDSTFLSRKNGKLTEEEKQYLIRLYEE